MKKLTLRIAVFVALTAALAHPVDAAAKSDPCAVAHIYVDLVNRGDYTGIGNLFAEQSEYLSYWGPEPFRGPKAIAEVYKKILSPTDDGRQFGKRTDVRARSYVGQGRSCVIELESSGDKAHPNDYVLISVDHFTIDDTGKITRFVVYVRPGLKLPAIGPAPAH